MRRVKQNASDILASLDEVETSWQDEVAEEVIAKIGDTEPTDGFDRSDILKYLESDFETGLLICRLFLGRSKDEFTTRLRSALGGGEIGVRRFEMDREVYISRLVKIGVLEAMNRMYARNWTWRDVLVERLKLGRGSAIKGQARGRALEDFVEGIVEEVFGPVGVGYQMRVRFVGTDGQSTEKTDVAIPGPDDPRILIEVKAFGATGSKQTDILGDLERIVQKKRADTTLLLVTDGLSWHQRRNDLKKIVGFQNRGDVARIYTRSMALDFARDLRTLRDEHGLPAPTSP